MGGVEPNPGPVNKTRAELLEAKRRSKRPGKFTAVSVGLLYHQNYSATLTCQKSLIKYL